MISANAALRAAVHDALAADSALHAALGGARVYDEPPRGALLPYVSIGEARVTVRRSTTGRPRNTRSRCMRARARAGKARLTPSPERCCRRSTMRR
jgi:hypothetical protein